MDAREVPGEGLPADADFDVPGDMSRFVLWSLDEVEVLYVQVP